MTEMNPPVKNNSANDTPKGSAVTDGSAFRDAFHNLMSIQTSVRQDILASDAKCIICIEDIICEWTLNLEQACTFKIIAEHSLEVKPNPLHMFLGSQGGTGKSRAINAL